MSAKRAVVDTNVLVSALISPAGAPARVLEAIQQGFLTPVLSVQVFDEYEEVLARTRFGFPATKVHDILALLQHDGLFLQPPTEDFSLLPDPDDAPFAALARHAACPLITGNVRHFPKKLGLRVMTPKEWVDANVAA